MADAERWSRFVVATVLPVAAPAAPAAPAVAVRVHFDLDYCKSTQTKIINPLELIVIWLNNYLG